MPNHLHLIVRVIKSISVEKTLFKFHSFTAHEIAKALERNNKVKLLEFFISAALEKKSDRKYLIWESSLVRRIETEEVLLARVEYTHNNPVTKSGDWLNLVTVIHYHRLVIMIEIISQLSK